jgi:hypothetical protein
MKVKDDVYGSFGQPQNGFPQDDSASQRMCGSFGQPRSGFPQDDSASQRICGSLGQPQSGFPQDDNRITLKKKRRHSKIPSVLREGVMPQIIHKLCIVILSDAKGA